jgi:hypothetical protein
MGIYRTTANIEIDVSDNLEEILDLANQREVNQWVCENVPDVDIMKMLLEASYLCNVREAINEAYPGGIKQLATDYGLIVTEAEG